MQPIYTYIIAAIILVALTTIAIFRQRRTSPSSARELYIRGLNQLLFGDEQQALETLQRVVRMDSDLIDPYIHIAEILQRKQNYESSIKVLRDLLARTNLAADQKKLIIKNLAINYRQNGQYQWALLACDHLLMVDKKDEWANNYKIELYEELGDWQKAFDALKKNHRKDKKQKEKRLACYKVEQGLQLADAQKNHEARLCYREAMKRDSRCYPAYYFLVKSYVREQRAKDALKELKRLVNALPTYAYLALNNLDHDLFELGYFEEIENFYSSVLQEHPNIVEAYVGLARIYEKKGALESAADLYRKALHVCKDDQLILQLIRVELELRRYQSVVNISEEMIPAHPATELTFMCAVCGYTANDYFWHCPQCKNWNSAKRG